MYADYSDFANSRSHAVAMMVFDIRTHFFTEISRRLRNGLLAKDSIPSWGNLLGLQTAAATVTVHALLQMEDRPPQFSFLTT
jgi:hypothetical protein